MKNYEFDRSSFSFRKVNRTVWNIVRTAVRLVLTSACVAIVTYFILSLFINTDTEKRLARENNMYEKVYAQMLEREQLIGDAVLSQILQKAGQPDQSVQPALVDLNTGMTAGQAAQLHSERQVSSRVPETCAAGEPHGIPCRSTDQDI